MAPPWLFSDECEERRGNDAELPLNPRRRKKKKGFLGFLLNTGKEKKDRWRREGERKKGGGDSRVICVGK